MRMFGAAAFAAIVVTGSLSAPAQAQIVSSDVGKNLEYQQTSGGVAAYNGGVNAFFFGREFSTTPADFSGGDVNGNAFNTVGLLDCCGHFGMAYQTGWLTPAAMDAAFPTGDTYTINAYAGAAPAQSVSILLDTQNPLNTDGYTSDIPQLTAASFTALSHAEPAGGEVLHFNSFTPDTNTSGQGFFSIFDYTTNATVLSVAGLAPSTTSLTVPGGTLTSGDIYGFELIFDDYIQSQDANSGAFLTARWGVRTLGVFSPTGGVPEPAAWTLMLSGFGLAGASLRRRRTAPA